MSKNQNAAKNSEQDNSKNNQVKDIEIKKRSMEIPPTRIVKTDDQSKDKKN